MFGDLQAFLDGGRALLDGRYSSYYPLPIVVFFAILSFLPAPLLILLILILSSIILVSLFKRQALLWLLFVPTLETLALGQLSIIWLWLLNRATPLSLALLTLKPHLFPLAIPILADRPILRRPFLIWCAVIYLPSLILRPTWPAEWIAQIFGDGRITHGTSASLWSMIWLIPIAAVALLLAVRADWRGKWTVLVTAINPAMRAYDYTLLSGKLPLLIPISWLAFGAMWIVGAAWPMAFIGIAAGLASHPLPGRLRNP